MSNTIIRIFKNTDMRNQHDGLFKVALEKKVRLDHLGAGEHALFLNGKLNRLKLYSHQGVVSYYRAKSGILNLNMIEMIPLCFSADRGMDWEKADRLALDKLLAPKKVKNPGKPKTSASREMRH